MVLPYEPIPIIDVPDLGNLCAVTTSDQFKVKSQNDKDQLQEEKSWPIGKDFMKVRAYRISINFYSTMIIHSDAIDLGN